MRNLNGYLKRTLFLFSILFVFSHSIANVSAENDLVRESDSSFLVTNDGTLNSRYSFNVSKKGSTPSVISTFNFSIPFQDYSSLKVSIKGKEYKYVATEENGFTKITLVLPTIIIDKDNPLKITSDLTISGFVNTTGENKYILIPPIPSFISGESTLSYPRKWGKVVWASSNWKEENGTSQTITLQKEDDDSGLNPGISIVIGTGLGYDFTISKTLQNTTEQNIIQKVSIPREGDGQHIVYKSFSPPPFDLEIDRFGNINASYFLLPSQTLQLNIHGYIYFDSFNAVPIDNFESFLNIDNYWVFQDDSEMKRFKVYMRGLGFNDEYNSLETKESRKEYVDALYTYTLNRFRPIEFESTESNLRRGVGQLNDIVKSGASPDEYTDLLIALLRYNSIPARMVLGYIPQLLSYNNESIFHSWVEYWDIDEGRWMQLDPALADYFPNRFVNTKFDHISVVVRSESSLSPQISRFSPNELSVIPALYTLSSVTQVNTRFVSVDSDSFLTKGTLEVNNSGNRIMRLKSIQIQNGANLYNPVNLWSIHSILPGEKKQISVAFNTSEIGSSQKIVVTYDDMEGNVYRKIVEDVNITSAKTNKVLINVTISVIIYIIVYLLLVRIQRKLRKNGK